MTFGLVHASYSLPEWQAVKLTFFAPWLGARTAFPNASNGLEHIFSNGFSQGLQRVREKNPTAFSNAFNALEQMVSTAFLNAFNG